jgi:tRNA(Ile2) C34 agmatinyltransferase TiaS
MLSRILDLLRANKVLIMASLLVVTIGVLAFGWAVFMELTVIALCGVAYVLCWYHLTRRTCPQCGSRDTMEVGEGWHCRNCSKEFPN